MHVHSTHLLELGGWLAGWLLLVRPPRMTRETADATAETVTVVIPARDEAARLPLLLEDLSAHRPAGCRVLVVDDHSTDGTAEVARRFPFVEVVTAPAIPQGWLGKAWACATGARHAGEGTLVFLDADVRVSGDGLAALVEERGRRGGLVSVLPWHETRRPYEALSALPNVVCFMATGWGSPLPWPRPTPAVFGMAYATTSADLAKAGGFESVAGILPDDLALGRRYREAGIPVRLFGGDRRLRVRLYGEGAGSLVAGWTRNLGLGVRYVHPARVLLLFFWLACSIGTLTWAGGYGYGPARILTALYAVQMGWFFRQVGSFGPLAALLYPLHVLFTSLVLLRGLLLSTVLRRVSWKGRTARVGGRRPPPRSGPSAAPRPAGPAGA